MGWVCVAVVPLAGRGGVQPVGSGSIIIIIISIIIIVVIVIIITIIIIIIIMIHIIRISSIISLSCYY